MFDKEKIIKEHPSICYECRQNRRPAADKNTEKGYVGCCIKVMNSGDFDFDDEVCPSEIEIAKEVGIGWVDLKSNVFSERGSGTITNFQVLTLEVKKCRLFVKDANE